MSLPEKLKLVREMNQLSGNQMASLLRISPPIYNNMERGELPKKATPDLERLAKLINVPVETLENDALELPKELLPISKEIITAAEVMGKLTSKPPVDHESIHQEAWRKALQRAVNQMGGQSELSEKIGVDVPELSKLLSGKKITQRLMFRVGAVTGRYDWYQAPAAAHQGDYLRDWLDFHQIKHQDFAQQMGTVKSNISDLLKRKYIKDDKWAAIVEALQVLLPTANSTYETIMQGVLKSTEPIGQGIENVPARLIRHVGNFSGEPIIALPFVPIRARAGLPTPAYWEHPIETTRIMQATLADYEPDPKNPRKSWWVIEIDGDSMEPQLRSRARVLAYYIGDRVSKQEWKLDKQQLFHLKPGVWAIQYDEEFVIKRVRENNLEREGGIMLHSDNPPPDPYWIRANSIRHVWFIETVVNSPVR